MGRAFYLAPFITAFWTAVAFAQFDAAAQKRQQQQIQADAAQVARRLQTMLRVLDFYQLDPVDQKRLFEELSAALAGLSEREMLQVVVHLEKALVDSKTADAEVEKAYRWHRSVVTTLRGLLARYEAVRDLEEAARRVEALAHEQRQRYLQTADLLFEADDLLNGKDISKPTRNVGLGIRAQGDHQEDLSERLRTLWQKVTMLRPHPSAEHQKRLAMAEEFVTKTKPTESLAKARNRLLAAGYPEERLKQWKLGNKLQLQTAGELIELARILHPLTDKLAALHEAQLKLAHAIDKQSELSGETLKSNSAAANKTLSLEQAKALFAAEDVAKPLSGAAPALAPKLSAAQKSMETAMAELAANATPYAQLAQSEATSQLLELQKQLSEQIAQLEKQKQAAQVDLAGAMQQLQKAIEQTNVAMQNAQAASQSQPASTNAANAMKQSLKATEGAQASLGQAQAQAPANIQAPLQAAAGQLVQAGQQLSKGQAGAAGKSQQQAMAKMQQALAALQSALAAANPGSGSQAAGPGQSQGQGQGLGQSKGQGQGQGQSAGLGIGWSQQMGPGSEKNPGQGSGNRVADGRVSNTPSQLSNVHGDGSFLHLPPRQRDLIRQAVTGTLPPEYSAAIQQYFMNLARGKRVP
ncbi:MAG: hypothetical protein L0215_09995 [Gemmataceae bacterium]|nr:hypothetical protein [Gemmataceae bacterium]